MPLPDAVRRLPLDDLSPLAEMIGDALRIDEHLRELSGPNERIVLRPARGTAGPSTIRHASTYAPVDVLASFDGLACLPAMSPSSFVLPEAPDQWWGWLSP